MSSTEERAAGRIIRIEPGAPIVREEDAGSYDDQRRWRRPIKRVRRATVAVVEIDDPQNNDLLEDAVAYADAKGNWRWTPVRCAHTVVDEDHRLRSDGRRIIGGHAIRGMGSVYETSGRCACGVQFRAGNAVELRRDWRDHIETTAEYGTFKIQRDRYDTIERGSIHDVIQAIGGDITDVAATLSEIPVGQPIKLDGVGIRAGESTRVTRVLAPAG